MKAKAAFGKRWSFYPWYRHWHIEVRVAGLWWIAGFNARRETIGHLRRPIGPRLRVCLYASPDATPNHPRAFGFHT